MTIQRLIALDGLRGVAAITVLMTHAELIAFHGYLAVDLFFIISGYVIAASYEPRLQSERLRFGQFMQLRLVRLYPMLLLGSVTGIVATLIGWQAAEFNSETGWATAIAAQLLLLIGAVGAPKLLPFNNPHWSIVWELLANAVHAAGLARARNRVLVLLASLSAIAMAACAAKYGSLTPGFSASTLMWGLPRVGFGYCAGVLLFRTRASWLPIVPTVSFTVPALLLFTLISAPIGDGNFRWIWPIYDLALVLLGFVPLVMLTIKARGGTVAAALGTLSYPLYALHEPLIQPLVARGAGAPTKLVAGLAMVALAWSVGKLIDEPLNRWSRRLVSTDAPRGGKTAAQPAGASAISL